MPSILLVSTYNTVPPKGGTVLYGVSTKLDSSTLIASGMLNNMFESAIAYVQTLVQQNGILGVFFATLIEEIIAPIPSALVPLAAGFSLLSPTLGTTEAVLRSLVVVGLPVAAGIAIGSTAVYAIAHVGGKPAIDRYGRWLGVTWADVEGIERRVSAGRGDELTLFALRLIPIIPGVAISAFCGAIRYPFTSFIAVTLAGSYVRAVVLGVIGWRAGELYLDSLHRIDQLEHILLIPLTLALAYLAWRYWHSRRRTVVN